MFKNNRQVMLYLDIKGTSDLDCPYIDIDTGWVNRIFKHFPEKAWNNTIINMNICVEYGTGDIWYSRVRTFVGMEKELSIDESVNVKFDYEII